MTGLRQNKERWIRTWSVRRRNRDEKDEQQVRMIKDRNGNVLTGFTKCDVKMEEKL